MNFISVGDMARAFQMRHQGSAMRQEINRLNTELTTGRKLDTGAALRGDFSTLAGIEGSLTSLAAYKTTTTEATLVSGTMQTVLSGIRNLTKTAGPAMVSTAETASAAAVDARAGDARQSFIATIGLLNTSAGGRFTMAGAASDQVPVASASDILGWLRDEVSGEIGANGVAAKVDAWFDAPPGGGGYLDHAYNGSAEPVGPIPLGPGEAAHLPFTAGDPEVRDVLKGLALAALVSEGLMQGNDVERARITQIAGQRVMSGDERLIAAQARLGMQEQAIAGATARNAAETTALTTARSAIAEADPFETATALEALSTQMETLYSVTARMSRLNLTSFLR